MGKKSSDSEGSSDSRILSHRRGVIVQEDKRVWSYVTPEQKEPLGGGRGWHVPPEEKNRKVKEGLHPPQREAPI